MHSYVVTRTTEIADRIRQAHRAGALDDELRAFVEVLECFPDYPASTFSPESLDRVRTQAEIAIDSVERWVDAHPGDGHNQRLVEYLYAIRSATEEINRWEQHYRGSTTNRSAGL
jgi:hypothetical protein